MDQPDTLERMSIQEISYVVAQSRVLDSQLTQKQVVAVLMSAEACGFRIVRKDWVESVCGSVCESVCDEHGWDDVGPVLSGRPN